MPELARLVPLIPVADVDRSIAFYQRLGFTVGRRIEMDEGRAGWAWIDNGAVGLMLARSEDPVSQHAQQMFYLYGADVLKMHAELTSAGVTCSSIESPFYAPRGEFRVEDPDGYVLMFTHSD